MKHIAEALGVDRRAAYEATNYRVAHHTPSEFFEVVWDIFMVMYYSEHGPSKEETNIGAVAGAATKAHGAAAALAPISAKASARAPGAVAATHTRATRRRRRITSVE